MPDYRVYSITRDNRIRSVPLLITHDSDQDAIQRAEEMLDDGHDIEVWQGARLVTRISAAK